MGARALGSKISVATLRSLYLNVRLFGALQFQLKLVKKITRSSCLRLRSGTSHTARQTQKGQANYSSFSNNSVEMPPTAALPFWS